MKFTDGYWRTRPDVTAHYPVHVHEVEIEAGPAHPVDALTVYGATRRLAHRGDTLNLALLTVRFSSPMPNVIRVQMAHHQGRRPARPAFDLDAPPIPGGRDPRRRPGSHVDQRPPDRARGKEG